MPDAISIGLSALQAHQRSMEVTSHNLANVATPGYSRQRVALGTPVPESTALGQMGRGVDATSIVRYQDQLIQTQMQRSSTEEGRLTQLVSTLSALESTFNEPSDTGLVSALARAQDALQALSNNPESHAIRTGTIAELETFARTLNGMSAQITGLREDAIQQLEGVAGEVNLLTAQISSLNESIRIQVASQSSPNDLLDTRDRALNDLSTLIDAKVRIDPKTQIAYVESGGRLLVDGSSYERIKLGSYLGNPSLSLEKSGFPLLTTGGKAGALLDLANEIIPETVNQLDELASNLIYQYNAVHAVGIAPDEPANRFLSQTIIGTSLTGTNLDDPSQALGNAKAGIAAAFLPRFVDDQGNGITGNLSVNIVNQATGVAEKYVITYTPGAVPPYADRSLNNLVDAINTGSGGGFTVDGPAGAAVPVGNLTASLIGVDGGVRMQLQAADGYSVDFSSALDTQPSSELRNAATWTGGAPVVSLGGRYTGSSAYDATQPWTMQVLAGGTVGSATTPPTVRFNWVESVNGSPVPRQTDVVLDGQYPAGAPVTIGDGIHAQFGTGDLILGDSLEMIVDGAGDQLHLLGTLGINTLFDGYSAATIRVADPVRMNPDRLASSRTRAVGDNSNILALLDVRDAKTFNGGSESAVNFISGMVANTGSQADLANRLLANQSVIRQALDQRQAETSGVSIDEEVGQLILQQQAYSAAARIITSAQENIRTLLGIFG